MLTILNTQKVLIPGSYADDRELWLSFKNGSESAFERIYLSNIDALESYGRQIVPNQDLVEDTIQELFVNIWNKRANLGDVSSIKGYLFKSLRRELLRKLKRERRFISESQAQQGGLNLVSDSAMDVMIRHQEEEERVTRLRMAMETFSKREKEIIHLRFFQGLSYESIAELLELNLKYVYNTASRAYQKLRDNFTF
jgi:RNA polymerase sigma factor (sigma-70 family)